MICAHVIVPMRPPRFAYNAWCGVCVCGVCGVWCVPRVAACATQPLSATKPSARYKKPLPRFAYTAWCGVRRVACGVWLHALQNLCPIQKSCAVRAGTPLSTNSACRAHAKKCTCLHACRASSRHSSLYICTVSASLARQAGIIRRCTRAGKGVACGGPRKCLTNHPQNCSNATLHCPTAHMHYYKRSQELMNYIK